MSKKFFFWEKFILYWINWKIPPIPKFFFPNPLSPISPKIFFGFFLIFFLPRKKISPLGQFWENLVLKIRGPGFFKQTITNTKKFFFGGFWTFSFGKNIAWAPILKKVPATEFWRKTPNFKKYFWGFFGEFLFVKPPYWPIYVFFKNFKKYLSGFFQNL